MIFVEATPIYDSFLEAVDFVYSKNFYDKSKEELKDHLFEIYNNKIDLNLAMRKDLQKLYILTEKQINDLFIHIKKCGYLLSIYELQTIESYDLQTIKILQFFTKIDKKNIPKRLSIKNLSNSYFLLRYKYPFNEVNKNIGTLDYLTFKAKIHDPEIYKFGFAAKKGRGEKFIFDKLRYGFNHYSLSLDLINLGYFNKIIIGDYQFGCGQGLISLSGYNFKKISDSVIILRNSQELKSIQSFNKEEFYRGLATSIEKDKFNLILFYSSLYLDGNVKYDSDLDRRYIESISYNSDYNSQKTLSKIDTIKEKIGGIALTLFNNRKQNNIGSAILFRTFDPFMLRSRSRNDFQYLLRGDKQLNFSLFGKYLYNSTTIFFEQSYSNINLYYKKPKLHDKIGYILGSMTAINRYLDFAICGRYYGKNFNSIRGNSLRENTKNKNEYGYYFGIKFTPYSYLVFNNYIDFFFFPAPTFKNSVPTKGIEYCTKAELTLNRNHIFTLKLNNKNKESEKLNKLYKKKELLKENIFRTKFKYQYIFDEYLSFKTHISTIFHKLKNLNISMLFAQDIEYKYSKFSIKARFALYNAKSDVNNTIFIYEYNLLYDNPRPVPYRNLGKKLILYLCYKPLPYLRIEFKYDLVNVYKKTKKLLKQGIGLQIMYRI